MFKSTVAKEEYTTLMADYKKRAASELFGGLQVTVLRTFRADPTTVLVRWKGTWRSSGATVEGNSTYKLGEDGLLTEHIDQYQARTRETQQQRLCG